MSRYHSDAEKRLVLDRLIANDGDVALTAAEFSLNPRTLYRWRLNVKKELSTLTTLTTLTTSATSPQSSVGAQHVAPSSSPPTPIPTDPDLITALTEIQQEMLANTRLLSKSIPEAIADAPLNQRILALVQLIDRIVKLNAQLPTESIQIVVKGSEGEEPDGETRTDSDDPTSRTEESNQL